MKTKIIKSDDINGCSIIAVLRWEDNPIPGDFKKVYVNYFYPYSVKEIESNSEIADSYINEKIVNYCKKNNLVLWSY